MAIRPIIVKLHVLMMGIANFYPERGNAIQRAPTIPIALA